MLKISATWICCFFFCFSFGQIKESYYEQYESDVSGKPVRTFLVYYNREGHPTKSVQHDRKDKNHLVTQVRTYTYDEQGRQKTVQWVQTSKGVPVMKSLVNYTHTADGYVTTQGPYKTIYHQDQNGNVIRSELFIRSVLNETSAFQFDHKKRKTLEHTWSARGDFDFLLTIQYDDSLNTHVERWKLTRDSVTTVGETEVSKRDEIPVKVTNLINGEIQVCTANEFGDVIETKTYNKKNKLIGTSKTTYKYWPPEN